MESIALRSLQVLYIFVLCEENVTTFAEIVAKMAGVDPEVFFKGGVRRVDSKPLGVRTYSPPKIVKI